LEKIIFKSELNSEKRLIRLQFDIYAIAAILNFQEHVRFAQKLLKNSAF